MTNLHVCIYYFSGNTFPYYMIGLAGLFIGLGEIIGENSLLYTCTCKCMPHRVYYVPVPQVEGCLVF